MKLVKRTKKEVLKEIKKISREDSENFTYDSYGSEACDNGIYELSFSEDKTEETLKNFVNWLMKKDFIK